MATTGSVTGRMRRAAAALALAAALAAAARADELLLHDGTWMTAMVDGVTGDGRLQLRLSSGEEQQVALEDVVAIYMKGRDPRSVRSGMQEFRLVTGDRLRGQILRMKGDDLVVHSHAAGLVSLPMDALEGFVALPQVGRPGRRAEQLLGEPPTDPAGFADEVLDRRCTTYEGVIEAVSDKVLTVDHERMMQPLDLPILYLAGVRLADRERRKAPALPAGLFLRVHCRDGSAVDGFLQKVEFGRWFLRSLCDPKLSFDFPVEEMVLVEVLNARTLYLSQVRPVEVREKTVLAPPAPCRVNANCLGNRMSIAGQEYAWGLGVHADSSLSFELGRRFEAFHASIGIDRQVGARGSVVFSVLGDGRALYKSPVLRGGEAARKISVPVKGVKQMTLRVEAGEDFDLGDCADWAMARLVRSGGGSAEKGGPGAAPAAGEDDGGPDRGSGS